MRNFDFVAYILAALRNTGLGDQREREEAAHDVVSQLLVSPGQLFAGYGVISGTLEARFQLFVQNAVRNLMIRIRRRREPISRAVSIGHGDLDLSAHAIPDRRHDDRDDGMMTAFRGFLTDKLGDDALRLLDRWLDGMSLRQLACDPAFGGTTAWALRRLMRRVRDAALAFARRQGDDDFLAAIERMTDG